MVGIQVLGAPSMNLKAWLTSNLCAQNMGTSGIEIRKPARAKMFAIQHAKNTTLWLSAPLMIFLYVFYPFIWLLNGAANGAMVVTNSNLDVIAEAPTWVVHQPDTVLDDIHALDGRGPLLGAGGGLAVRGAPANY